MIILSWRLRWTGHVSQMGEKEMCKRLWYTKLKERIRITRHRWEDIKIGLKEIG
jgi:hypothetical protein